MPSMIWQIVGVSLSAMANGDFATGQVNDDCGVIGISTMMGMDTKTVLKVEMIVTMKMPTIPSYRHC